MIDINELRQSAQAATPGPWYIGSGTYEGRNIYSVEAVTDDEGFTYNPVVATAEDDDVVCWEANARLIAAANPAVISELLDRLEAAEADALEQARLNGMGAEREAALLAKLEAAEKERDYAKAAAENIALKLDYLRSKLETAENAQNEWLRANAPGGWIDNLRVENEAAEKERDVLKAKIERMEKQEPVTWQTRTRPAWNDGTWGPWRKCSEEYAEDIKKTPLLHDWLYEARALYALPGAQPAPSIPDDVMRDAKRYRFLRAAKNIPISTEAARDPIAYDAAIDAAMLAAAPEAKT